jgi:hypothetical protein
VSVSPGGIHAVKNPRIGIESERGVRPMRKITLICVVVLIAAMSLSACAKKENRIEISDIPLEYEVGEVKEIPDEVYQRRDCAQMKELTLGENANVNTYASGISDYEEVDQSLNLRDYKVEDFESFVIPDYQLDYVCQVNERVYLQYSAEDGNILYLGYENDWLVEQTFYDSKTDTAISILGERVTVYEDFFSSSYHEY